MRKCSACLYFSSSVRQLPCSACFHTTGHPNFEPVELIVEPQEPHPLQLAFDACIHQVTKGKGERHGGESKPFFEQPWYTIAEQTGPGGLIFQGMKKAGEACSKPDQETFERELLGAIVYLAMGYLFVKKNGSKRDEDE